MNTTAEPIAITYAADAPTPGRLMFLAAAAFGGATDSDRWIFAVLFVKTLRGYGMTVPDFVELLECAAGEAE